MGALGHVKAWRLILAAVVVWFGVGTGAQNTNEKDAIALQKLKASWGGGTLSWTGSDPCGDNWEGIVCNKDGRVVSLYLVSRDLKGNIPPDIGDLTALLNLDLSFNRDLWGELPPELGNLASLNYMGLQKCRLTGQIPATLGQLSNLTFLALNNNKLTGSIPSALGAMKKLKWFDVAYNSLSGPLPVSTTSEDGLGVDTWPAIEHYHLNDNKFTGSIPPEIGNSAHKCIHMLLEVNQFTGTIPESFGNLTALQILSLHFNQLTGPVPASLNKIIKNGTTQAGLLQIRLANNSLTGTLPTLDALKELEYVDFSNNPFDVQPFPTWLNASLNTIQTIRFENGNIGGPLPDDILSYPALQGLYLRDNKINGTLTIPANINPKLRYVSLQNNKLASLNNQLTSGPLETQIMLQGNPICSPGGLVKVDASLCNATDTPLATKWTSSLISTNNCSSNLCSTARLTHNPRQCQCSYPLVVTLEVRAPTFSTIDNNTLWDALHDQTVHSLQNLSAAEVPPLRFESTQLWVHDAAFNGSQLRVEVRLYFFPLTGEVMDTATAAWLTRSFTNQRVKYSSPFKPELVRDLENSQGIVAVVTSGLSKMVIIGIAVGAGAVLVVVGFLVLLVLRMRRKADTERKMNPFGAWDVDGGLAPQLKGANWFTFDDIKQMTNNFSEENELGEGGYGKVYMGIQAGTGTRVAVKRAQEGSKQGSAEFKTEIELLSRVHHNNLVKLVGFCYEKNEQMLVYEFVPNGTLTDWLRGSRSDQSLDWDRRLLVALGAARGLAYLHDNADPPIIHRDVKSCNILLDKKMNVKVADFGLSTLVSNDRTGKSKANPSIKGTMGYLDPEYYMTNEMSPKSDVYSFGVVLLETLTGKPPIYRGCHIVRDVRNRFDKNGIDGVREILDPALTETLDEELEAFINIALVCVEDTALERPHMHDVVKQLEAIVGPKAHLMPGGDSSNLSKARVSKREQKSPLLMPPMTSNFDDDFEPVTGQFAQPSGVSQVYSQGSTSSQQSSFKYSGGFAPNMTPQPK